MVKRFKKLKQILISGKSDLTPDEIRKIKLKLKNILTNNTSNNDEKNYAKYIKEIFNSKIINMFILYLNKNRNILREKEYDIEQNFINKFIHLIKDLNLNEIELVYLTLLLDKIGWGNKSIDYWNYFHCLGVYTKRFSVGELYVEEYLEGKDEFMENYSDIINQKIFIDYEDNKFTTKEINQRYKELTKPINSFCRKNFINYNNIVDKIFNSTQTYQSKNNKKTKNNNNDNNNIIINNNVLNNINEENEEKKEKSILPMNYLNPNHNSFFGELRDNRNDVINFYKNKNMSFIAEKQNYNITSQNRFIPQTFNNK